MAAHLASFQSRPEIGDVLLSAQTHAVLLVVIVFAAVAFSWLCRANWNARRPIRLAMGYGLAANEFFWWAFRYSHEGIHLANLPLQLCDVTLWATVTACLTVVPWIVEFAYFAGIAGAGMALLTPDLWSPWPTYPAVYFFVAHGGIVIACALLTFGGIAPPRKRAALRALGVLIAYAVVVGIFNWAAGSNYMYLCTRPANASLLDWFGPWPMYLLGGALAGSVLFWALSLPSASRHKFQNQLSRR